MSKHDRVSLAVLAFFGSAVLVSACAGEPEVPPDADGDAEMEATGSGSMSADAAAGEPRVEISSPQQGATVEGPDVTVELEAVGFQVVEAGDTTANSGHHHLFLDRDVSPAGAPIPTEEGYIIHMGTGAAEYTFEAVEAGEHQLIAVVGDAVHVPVDPPLADTVRFVVR